MKIISVFLSFLIASNPASGAVRYDGYQLLRVLPNNEHHIELLQDLAKQSRGVLDFWRLPVTVSHPVDILIPPRWSDYVRGVLLVHGVEFETTIADVQQLIDSKNGLPQRSMTSSFADFNYNTYHTFEEISQWIDNFSDENDKLVSNFSVTTSYEGRPIRGVKLGVYTKDDSRKPAVYFQGGIHGREWISLATVINICNKLVRGYGVDNTVTLLLNTFDFYIVPVLNVDGYSYTHSTLNTVVESIDRSGQMLNDRLWRKNRSPNRFSSCIGTDLNRNFPNHWNGEGASSYQCDYCYRGDYESSEIEIQGIVNFLMELKASGTDFLSFVDFHNFSQMILYPWAYSAKANPSPDFHDHYEAAAAGISALSSVYGTKYSQRPVSMLLYSASGNSIDWGYENLGAKYSYAIELRDTGQYGFLLPEDQIEPTGVETFEFVKSLGKTILMELQNRNGQSPLKG